MDETQLTNFNVPLPTRKRFDAVCRASGRTRTSVLVELMTDHILKEGRRLTDQQSELEQIDAAIGKSRSVKRFSDWGYPDGNPHPPARLGRSDQEFDLPEPLRSDGWDGW
ncbi:MAG: hypothetical protein RIS00_1756 [Pseudomonadota bacterium]|jgi:hypothetical protein